MGQFSAEQQFFIIGSALVGLGAVMLAIFGVWIAIANAIYVANFGEQPLTSPFAFAYQVLTTPEGRRLKTGD